MCVCALCILFLFMMPNSEIRNRDNQKEILEKFFLSAGENYGWNVKLNILRSNIHRTRWWFDVNMRQLTQAVRDRSRLCLCVCVMPVGSTTSNDGIAKIYKLHSCCHAPPNGQRKRFAFVGGQRGIAHRSLKQFNWQFLKRFIDFDQILKRVSFFSTL